MTAWLIVAIVTGYVAGMYPAVYLLVAFDVLDPGNDLEWIIVFALLWPVALIGMPFIGIVASLGYVARRARKPSEPDWLTRYLQGGRR